MDLSAPERARERHDPPPARDSAREEAGLLDQTRSTGRGTTSCTMASANRWLSAPPSRPGSEQATGLDARHCDRLILELREPAVRLQEKGTNGVSWGPGDLAR